MTTGRSIQTWERAEIERSSIEAAHVLDQQLRTDDANIRRYQAPPETTPYPLEYAFHLLGDARGKVVLDFGCGTGENSLVLARRGAQVIGFDISESLVRLAGRRMRLNGMAGQARFIAASAHDLPIASGSVDVVFGIAILHHLDLRRVAAETHRILAPGGRGIFQEPVRNSKVIRAVRAMIPYRSPDVSPFERPLTDGELRQFAEPFRAVRMRAFALPHVSVATVVPALRRLIHPFYRIDGTALRAFPWLARYAGIRVIEVVK